MCAILSFFNESEEIALALHADACSLAAKAVALRTLFVTIALATARLNVDSDSRRPRSHVNNKSDCKRN